MTHPTGAAAGLIANQPDLRAGPLYSVRPRGPTSRQELTIAWDYPVLALKGAVLGNRSSSVALRTALPVADAFAAIAGEDQRPLLVLRECTTCTGTDDALMTRQADNERTMLLSRWFHCVKLPPDVLDDDHPFRNLFPESDSSHLFVARRDGAKRHDLDGAQSRTELWDAMGNLLVSEYKEKTERPVKDLLRLLDQYDALDERIAQVEIDLDREIEKAGPASSKAKKKKKELTKLHNQRNDLRSKAMKISDLQLRPATVRTSGAKEQGSA